MARKKSTPASRRAMFAPMSATPIMLGLRKAQLLLRDNEPEEAVLLLRDLDAKYPEHLEVLRELENAALTVGLMSLALSAREGIVRLLPDSPEEQERLGKIYMNADRPVLAVREWRSVLERFPAYKGADKIREILAMAEPAVEEMLESSGLTGESRFEDAALHEEVQNLLEAERYAETRERAEELLQRRPDFAPARNNIAQSYYAEGNLSGAIAATEAVLAHAPANIHALANLARYLFLSGREDEARQAAERLKASDALAASRTVKILETLALLGDDAGVLETFRAGYPDAEKGASAKTPNNYEAAMSYHLAAVSLLRQGDETAARRLWEAVMQVNSPSREIASENLAQLRRPVGERDAPWPFSVGQWLNAALLHHIDRLLRAVMDRDGDEDNEGEGEVEPSAEAVRTVQEAKEELYQAHPELFTLYPHLLDRGDPKLLPILGMLASELKDPHLLAALRDYGLGQRGPDAVRMQAVQTAVDNGLLDPGKLRFYSKGEWQEVSFYGWEITEEPMTDDVAGHRLPSPEILEMIEEGINALKAKDGGRAETIFRSALTKDPDSPNLLNNLASALVLQGRGDEGLGLIRQIHERFPDYSFARINLAIRSAKAGKIAEARALVEPVLARRKIHVTEFSALCKAQIEIALADDQKETARHWLNMWMESGIADPNDPTVMDYLFRVLDMEELMKQGGLGRAARRAKPGRKRGR